MTQHLARGQVTVLLTSAWPAQPGTARRVAQAGIPAWTAAATGASTWARCSGLLRAGGCNSE
jgi:hypothetical protein